jgi:hypothetical protein
MFIRSSVQRLALLLALCGCCAAFQVQAAEPCPAVEGQFAGANPTFKSGQELPREGTFSLVLQPGETVDYLVGSRRVKGEAGYGGVVTLRKLWAGRYRLFLSSAADLELIQNYSALTLTECRGEEASYVVSIDEGMVLLQVRGASTAVIDIAFLKL